MSKKSKPIMATPALLGFTNCATFGDPLDKNWELQLPNCDVEYSWRWYEQSRGRLPKALLADNNKGSRCPSIHVSQTRVSLDRFIKDLESHEGYRLEYCQPLLNHIRYTIMPQLRAAKIDFVLG